MTASSIHPLNFLSPSAELEGRFIALEGVLLESLVEATPAALRSQIGLRVQRRGSLTAIACDSDPHLLFNRLCGAGLSGSLPDPELRAGLDFLRAAGRADNFLALVSESADGPRLAREMSRLGLAPFRRDWVALVRAPRPAAPVSTRFRIARATLDHALPFAEILLEGFNLAPTALAGLANLVGAPGWHVHVALDGARVAAGGALFVHEGLAYLAFGATRPSERGAGAHDALIARRIELARELGCDTLIVETGTPVAGEPSPSLDNLRAAGFRPAFLRRAFAPPGTGWSGRAG